MSDLVNISNLQSCLRLSEEDGKSLYDKNENYRDIATFMEHPEFRKLYDKYFSSNTEIKTILMFMKLYEYVEKMSPVQLTGYQKISFVNKLISDSTSRHEIVKKFTDHVKLIK